MELSEGLKEYIKGVWEVGIKLHPEIRPLGIELIKQIKLLEMGAEGSSEEKVDAARRVFDMTLTSLQEEANGTD